MPAPPNPRTQPAFNFLLNLCLWQRSLFVPTRARHCPLGRLYQIRRHYLREPFVRVRFGTDRYTPSAQHRSGARL